MKGILLAGGAGTRLHPLTLVVSKQLLPIYNKPMVYYPLSTLMLAGIRDILLISTPSDLEGFRRLLGDGSHLGLQLEYAVQPRPEGLAQSFVIGRDFIGIARGTRPGRQHLLWSRLDGGAALGQRARIGRHRVRYTVKDPERYGVVEFGRDGRAINIVEKPNHAEVAVGRDRACTSTTIRSSISPPR